MLTSRESAATTWVNARRAPRPAQNTVVLVRGPGLARGGAEIPYLATTYPAAHVIEADTATASTVLKALDGSSLAHLAAHGQFRADSPTAWSFVALGAAEQGGDQPDAGATDMTSYGISSMQPFDILAIA